MNYFKLFHLFLSYTFGCNWSVTITCKNGTLVVQTEEHSKLCMACGHDSVYYGMGFGSGACLKCLRHAGVNINDMCIGGNGVVNTKDKGQILVSGLLVDDLVQGFAWFQRSGIHYV